MKNVKRSIQMLSLFAMANLFAQTAPEVQFETNNDSLPLEERSHEYLLAHRVYLRETPSLTAKKVTVLDIGSKLRLSEKSINHEELNGIKSHWYKARIGKYEGWVWGGMIAQKTFGSQANYDVKFVYGLERIQVNKEGGTEIKHQLRAFKNGRQIDKIVFDGYLPNPMVIKNIGNKGMFNVEDIITLNIPNAENGNPIGTTYIFWNNGKFTNVASLIDYSDAAYAKSEQFVFPSDMEGIKSTIVLETMITDYQVATADDLTTENTKMIVSFYTWDGYQLSQKESLPPISMDLVSNAK